MKGIPLLTGAEFFHGTIIVGGAIQSRPVFSHLVHARSFLPAGSHNKKKLAEIEHVSSFYHRLQFLSDLLFYNV